MLTVWCLWWRDPADPDKYSAYHVQRLKRTVSENLTLPHRFVCVTAEEVEGVETIPPVVDWPGWWGKLAVLAMSSHKNLFFDLDVVVTGSLDPIAQYANCEIATPANWAQSGHGGIQSSVMAWRGALYGPYIDVDPKWLHWPPVNKPGVFWGDQEVLTHYRNIGALDWTEINADWIKSYKYHCRDGLPDDCRVTVWHGEPKPENVKTDWFTW